MATENFEGRESQDLVLFRHLAGFGHDIIISRMSPPSAMPPWLRRRDITRET